LSSLSSSNLQIFGKEKEIPLFIQDGGDEAIENGDFILFFAERNDGWLDSTLYDNEEWIGNPKYSLYNDTLQYFLTWNSSSDNFRFIEEPSVDFENYTADDFVVEETFNFYSNSYNEGEKSADASSSFYMPGEGWGSTAKNGSAGYIWDFGTLDFAGIYQGIGAPLIDYESVVVGRSNAAQTNPGSGNHHTRHTIGSSNFTLVDSVFTGYQSVFVNGAFPVDVLPSNGSSNFKVNIVGDLNVATDYQSINYWSFRYPRSLTFTSETIVDFEVINSGALKSKIEILGGQFDDPVAFVVGAEPYKLTMVENNGIFRSLVPNATMSDRQKVFISSNNSIQDINSLNAVNESGFFTDYASNPNLESILLFVFNKQLGPVVNEYAAHRSSLNGGSYNVLTAEVSELYQQYGGGIPKHINGIRRFAHHIYELSGAKPVGLFLLGKGIREANITSLTSIGPGSRTNNLAYQNSLVPSFSIKWTYPN
jgi:hypothetical protein